jgi:hypothetical protein
MLTALGRRFEELVLGVVTGETIVRFPGCFSSWIEGKMP